MRTCSPWRSTFVTAYPLVQLASHRRFPRRRQDASPARFVVEHPPPARKSWPANAFAKMVLACATLVIRLAPSTFRADQKVVR